MTKRTIKKRMLSMFLALCLILTLLPAVALADTVYATTYSELVAQLNNTEMGVISLAPASDFDWPTEATTLDLTKPTYLKGSWTIPTNVTVTTSSNNNLSGSLNGGTITVAGTLKDAVGATITVASGGTMKTVDNNDVTVESGGTVGVADTLLMVGSYGSTSTGSLSLKDGANVAAGNMRLYGALVSDGATLSCQVNVLSDTTISGTLTMTKTVSVGQEGTDGIVGTLTIPSGSTLHFTPDTGEGICINNGTLKVNGTLDVNGAATTRTSAISFGPAGSMTIASGSMVTVRHPYEITCQNSTAPTSPYITGSGTLAVIYDSADVQERYCLFWIDISGNDQTFEIAKSALVPTYIASTINLAVGEAPAQDLSWNGSDTSLSTTYGTPITGKTAANSSSGGSTVTYSSSNTNVATVDNAGALTTVGAGETTITATAAAVAGTYRETSVTYTLTVSPKALTASDLEDNASTKTKVYDGTTAASGVAVKVKAASLVNISDTVAVTGTAAYNSKEVADANSIIFTPDAITTGNYSLDAGQAVAISGASITAKPVTVTVDTASRAYGAVNPTFTGSAASDALAAGDTYAGLGMSYQTTATDASNVGSYEVTGNGTNTNYNITVAGTNKLTITAVTPTYTVPDTANIKVGSSLAVFTATSPANGTGVSGRTVTGATTWYSNIGMSTEAVEADVSSLDTGNTKTLYWKFVPDSGNYSAVTGQTMFTVVAGDPQTLTFKDASKIAAYGDASFTNKAANNRTDGGTISYSSGNTTVATVNSSTGAVTIHAAGTAVITANVTAVSGKYAAGRKAYTLTVNPKDITVTVTVASRKFGEADPIFAATVTTGALVGTDSIEGLGLGLTSSATAASTVGTYDVVGDGSYNTNYAVTIDGAGKLTVTKADAPAAPTVTGTYAVSVTDNTKFAYTVTAIIGAEYSKDGTNYQSSNVFDTIDPLSHITFYARIKGTTNVNESTAGNTGVVAFNKLANINVPALVYAVTGDSGNRTITVTPVTGAEYKFDSDDWSISNTKAGLEDTTVNVQIRYAETATLNASTAASIDANTAKAVQTLSFASSTVTKLDSDADFTVTASNDRTDGGKITYTSGTHSVATVDSTTGKVTIVGVGSTVITATAEENTAYSNGTASYTLTVSKEAITVPVSSDAGSVKVTATVSGDTATVSVTDEQLSEIASDTENTGTVKVDVSALDVNTAVIPEKIVSAANTASGSTGLEITLKSGSVTLDKTALTSIAGKGDIKVNVETITNSMLTDAQKKALGNQAESATVVDVNVYVNGVQTHTFNDGIIEVSVPYTLKSGESANSITVWFVKNDGTIEPITAVYKNGYVTFTTAHLSQYLIVNFPFTDVADNAWYYGNAAYAYTNDLFSGTSTTTFSPETAMPRGMLVTVLWRIEGKPAVDGMNAYFSDVTQGSYYESAIGWAAKNGIVYGYGDGRFGPDDSITREQVVTILYRYAQVKSYDTTQGGMTLQEFDDYESVSSYARTAMTWAVNAGLIQGYDNKLMPADDATRAQVAAIFQRFCEKVKA